jgi:hypothetical protein
MESSNRNTFFYSGRDPNMPTRTVVLLVALTSSASALVLSPAPLRAATTAISSRAGNILAQETAMKAPTGWMALWPEEKKADIRIEGGKTLKTFKMPDYAERVQYIIQSPNGRPVKAKVELWIGPIRCVTQPSSA